jgi:hypothetical protein
MQIGIKCEECKMQALIIPIAKDRYQATPRGRHSPFVNDIICPTGDRM